MSTSLLLSEPLPSVMPKVTYETKMVVRMTPAGLKLTGEYPCACRLCRDLARASERHDVSPIAAIDVFDLPDEVDGTVTNYFH